MNLKRGQTAGRNHVIVASQYSMERKNHCRQSYSSNLCSFRGLQTSVIKFGVQCRFKLPTFGFSSVPIIHADRTSRSLAVSLVHIAQNIIARISRSSTVHFQHNFTLERDRLNYKKCVTSRPLGFHRRHFYYWGIDQDVSITGGFTKPKIGVPRSHFLRKLGFERSIEQIVLYEPELPLRLHFSSKVKNFEERMYSDVLPLRLLPKLQILRIHVACREHRSYSCLWKVEPPGWTSMRSHGQTPDTPKFGYVGMLYGSCLSSILARGHKTDH